MKKTVSLFTAIFLCLGIAAAVYVAASAAKSLQYEEKLDAADERQAQYMRDNVSLSAENERLRKLLSLYGEEEPSAPEESADISAGPAPEESEDTSAPEISGEESFAVSEPGSAPGESGEDSKEEASLTERQEAVLTALKILQEARNSVETLYVFKGDSPFAIDVEEIDKLVDDTCRKLLTDTSVPVSDIKDYLLGSYFAAIKDPFTLYHTRADMQELEEQSAGKLYGIGVYVYFDEDNSALYIERVMPGSPAEKAGLMIGDRIKSIEGVEVSRETYDECIASVAGELNTEVTLVIERGGEVSTVKPLRGEVRVCSVYTDYVGENGEYAMINIKEFSGHVAEDFAAAINEAESRNVKGYIFDVRDNPGGDLQIICNVLDILLPEGPIVTIVAYNGETYSYSSDSKCIDKPMVVLCNGNTASAGELFTSALKDYKIATVIGETTYGKGTMQQIYYLSDRSGFRVSMAYYNPPFSENYHLVGVKPDKEVEQGYEVTAHPFLRGTEDDLQYLAALEELDAQNANN